MKAFLTAEEATQILGINRSTLYAYVSRGLIRSEEGDSGKRTRAYHAEDIARLRQRKEQRRDPDKAAVDTLNWGAPIIESALTRIADGRVYYRGHDVVALAAGRSIEEVASLLWTGAFDRWDPVGTRLTLPESFWTVRDQLAHFKPYDLLRILLPIAATRDPAAVDLRPEAVASTGRRIVRIMIAALTGRQQSERGISNTLANYWSGGIPYAGGLINSALILCGDHELNTSSFTARCVASTCANPYSVVEAGLAALSGYKHGGMSELVEDLLSACEGKSEAEIRSILYDRMRRGERLPGFGHPLYPEGDPRGQYLLDAIGNAYPAGQSLASAALAVSGERPNLDFGLVAVARALKMPPGSSLVLFALGRTIGWIGHAIEEYQRGRLIRPRARYVGTEGIKAPAD